MHFDIFCSVVDNLGDIGVCWRLSRQLAREHGAHVRLWVDDLVSFRRLAPAIDPRLAVQPLGQLQVCHWPVEFPADVEVADIVVETFGCELPTGYVRKMKSRARPPVWINLEYLSAESWVDRYHALPSPQPPLNKYFFFPGFSARTGGVLKEQGLDEARQAFQADDAAQGAFLRRFGVARERPGERLVSMFCYPQAPLPALLDAWRKFDVPMTVIAFAGAPGAQALAGARLDAGLRKGALRGCVVPFLDQDDYDRMLWACDWNFVRGEDSFVRAQWAARPFVWQAYPQQESGHRIKVQSFLARYLEGENAGGLVDLWTAWNGLGGSETLATAWAQCMKSSPRIGELAASWPQKLASVGDLAANLTRFCEERV